LILKTINTLLGPKAIGPYSSARVYNGVMYVAGNIGIDPKTMQLVS
jgi:2-iminobutanoate/2-iminopropanoate deaminase